MVMATLVVSLLITIVLEPGITVILYAITLGAAGGSSRTVTSTLAASLLAGGRPGALQGTATLITVASTALGPVLFSLARDATGSYGVAAAWFALIPIGVAIGAASLEPALGSADHAEAS